MHCRYVESNPATLQNFATTSVAGLGVGLLASTAAALSSQPGQLPLAGADIVTLAFRMGIHVQEISENLEARDPSSDPETWAFVVHNVDPIAAQTELDIAHARDGAPETGKIFISATSPTSITVSGPPTRLKAIFHKLPFFRDAKSVPLPVYGGLCHAPHIYSSEDAERILATQRRPLHAVTMGLRPVMDVYSTSTGQPYPAETSRELYAAVLMELLTKSISWHLVVDALELASAKTSDISVHSFGNSMPLMDLTTGLKNTRGDADITSNSLCTWYEDTASVDSLPRGPAQDKLAIVGMSCRLPGGATSTEKFWEVLEQGLDVSRQIPADRFDIETHYDPTGKQLNKTMTQYGCFIDEPGLFDAPFFNMSPREAQVTDPQMRLSLVTAYEALERAGYVGNRTFSTKLQRIGTYYGQAADDYRMFSCVKALWARSTLTHHDLCRGGEPRPRSQHILHSRWLPRLRTWPHQLLLQVCRSKLQHRHCLLLWTCGNRGTDRLHSPGAAFKLIRSQVACQALWAGDVDTAVAGGVNVLTNPDGFSGLCNGHFLTKGHNACKTWDASADGYCRADAVGSVVIKRLQDAEADNDNILGVVLGAGTNHSATAVSITHPHAGHQAYLARQVLGKAGVDPLDVSYAELHGTGTQGTYLHICRRHSLNTVQF